MPRQKGSSPRSHFSPTRLQDGTGLEQGIFITIIDEFVTPMTVRIEALEGQVAQLLAALGAMSSMTRATLELKSRRHGGTVYLEGAFSDEQIGKPVLIVQCANGDGDEFGIVQFTGEVINARKLRVRWHAEHGAPRRVEVVYLIGSTEGAGT